jgi:integrase
VAVDEGRLPSNPASGIKMEKAVRRGVRYLTAQQVRGLAGEVPRRYEALILFLGFTGARIGEAAALKVRNLRLLERKALIVEAVRDVNGVLHAGPTKNRQARSVTLPGFLVEKLAGHLEEFSDPATPDALVFAGPKGRPNRHGAFRTRVFKGQTSRA